MYSAAQMVKPQLEPAVRGRSCVLGNSHQMVPQQGRNWAGLHSDVHNRFGGLGFQVLGKDCQAAHFGSLAKSSGRSGRGPGQDVAASNGGEGTDNCDQREPGLEGVGDAVSCPQQHLQNGHSKAVRTTRGLRNTEWNGWKCGIHLPAHAPLIGSNQRPRT